MPDTHELKAVLFDLDGTLVDTAPDLANALNRLLERHGRPSLPLGVIRPYVSHGSIGMLGIGLGIDQSDPAFDTLRAEFLDIYASDLSRGSQLFPGMDRVLEQLEQRGLSWGVVTNKPGFLTRPLLDDLELSSRSCCIVSGDTLEQRKPHPAPMYHAAGQAGASPKQCVYVGDAWRDIEAGNNAGMYTLVALYGYLSNRDRPLEWQADGAIERPVDLLHWIDDHG